ncbi:MAG: histidinol-phosphate transaminase [Nitrospirae bacterium GWC2_56_14]|nr:MAG: histidinol-phosphate transaminase [Nitrospirae bacterium GWC2_56_14]
MKKTRRKDIATLIKPQVRRLAAYHIDETPCRIKLDAMENPFSLPTVVQRELAKAVNSASINRYPDPSAKKLTQAIAGFWGMKPANLILGNGSDELIQAILLAFGGPTLIPVPTFAMYEITSRALSQTVVTVPLDKNFDLDADLLLKKAKESKAKVIFLACPNNPTGNRFSDKAVRRILDRADAAVVLDEAYFSFSGKSYLSLLQNYPNMIVLRTLSKIGLAGLRIGVLAASPEIVAELNKIRLPYNINSLSQAAAVAVLKHRAIIERQISLLISERENLYNALAQMKGVTAYPSETNFILFRTAVDATTVYGKLKKAGILIKNLNKPGPLKNCLRVTIGTKEENKEFLKTVRNILDTD